MEQQDIFSPAFIRWAKTHIDPTKPLDIAALSAKAPKKHQKTLKQLEDDPNYQASFIHLLPFLFLLRRYPSPYYYRRYRRRRYRRRRYDHHY